MSSGMDSGLSPDMRSGVSNGMSSGMGDGVSPGMSSDMSDVMSGGLTGGRFVVFRQSALGDVVLLTGVLDYWRRTRGLSFVVVTAKALVSMFEEHPAVEAVVGLEGSERRGRPLARRMEAVAREHPGAGLLDLHGKFSVLLATRFWNGWPGPVRRYPKFTLSRRLYNRLHWNALYERLSRLNAPQRYSLTLETEAPPAAELRPLIRLREDEREAARERLRGLFGADAGRAVALHPYATHANKAWPAERWRELARSLEAQGRPSFVVGRAEEAERVFTGPQDLTSATSLRETCALLEQAAALVTGDSGPMHLGTAVRTPVLALFGPTDRAWGFYPSGAADRVLEPTGLACRPCSLHGGRSCPRDRECLRSITAGRVLETLTEMVGDRSLPE